MLLKLRPSILMKHGSSQAIINLHDIAPQVLSANLQRNDPQRASFTPSFIYFVYVIVLECQVMSC